MPEIKASISKLRLKHPADYVERILSKGRAEGDWVYITVAKLPEVLEGRNPTVVRPGGVSVPPPLPPEAIANPSLVTMAKTFGFSIWRWARCGFKLTSEADKAYRQTKCNGGTLSTGEVVPKCPHWDAKARAGLGKCAICGCTGMKFDLPDEKCPDKPPRWGAVEGVPWSERLS